MAKKAAGDDWHHFISVADVADEGVDVAIEAGVAECAAAAKLLKILGIGSLSLEARVRPWHKAGLRVDGRVRSKVSQACVVTLDPVDEFIDETFEARFLPEHRVRPNESAAEIVIDALEEEDPPELMIENRIDLGMLAVEHLALALDPYPRKEGVELDDLTGSSDGDVPEKRSGSGVFAALRGLNPDGGDN